jgi:hypothetical protein
MALVQRFWQENRLLWRDLRGGISMSITTSLQGVGATLQLLVLRWAHEALGFAVLVTGGMLLIWLKKGGPFGPPSVSTQSSALRYQKL